MGLVHGGIRTSNAVPELSPKIAPMDTERREVSAHQTHPCSFVYVPHTTCTDHWPPHLFLGCMPAQGVSDRGMDAGDRLSEIRASVNVASSLRTSISQAAVLIDAGGGVGD